MPLQIRLPKRGFKNPNRTEYVALNLNRLQEISEKYAIDTLDMDMLVKAGIVRKRDLIKILASGELKAKLNISAHACSATAKAAVEAQGGSINIL